MQVAYGKCASCGGHHDRLHVERVDDNTFVGACPSTKEPVHLHLGVTSVPPSTPTTAAATQPSIVIDTPVLADSLDLPQWPAEDAE